MMKIISLLQEFIEGGGALLVLLGEGGETEFNTNINFLLEDYGMTINNGKGLRPSYIYVDGRCKL